MINLDQSADVIWVPADQVPETGVNAPPKSLASRATPMTCMIKGSSACINGPKQEIQWTLFAATRFTITWKVPSTGWSLPRLAG
jgi:hypothetical protein